MPSYRQIQFTAIVLILAAGFLWSQRLATQTLEASHLKINLETTDQLQLVQEKVATKNEPLQLLEFGRKLLASGNPRFAVVAFERATALQPKMRDAWYLLGYSYAQVAKKSENTTLAVEAVRKAVKALETAQKLDPGHKLTNDLLKQLLPSPYNS